jgi:hypothetical protein
MHRQPGNALASTESTPVRHLYVVLAVIEVIRSGEARMWVDHVQEKAGDERHIRQPRSVLGSTSCHCRARRYGKLPRWYLEPEEKVSLAYRHKGHIY